MRKGWPGLLLGLTGIALLTAAAVMDIKREQSIESGREARGVVVRLDYVSNQDVEGYRTIARFTAEDGTSQLVQSKVLSALPPRVGTMVAVVYPIGHPEQAFVADWLGRWFDIAVVAGLGTMLLAIGVFGTRSEGRESVFSRSW
jgi:hypothetical protein